MLNLCIRMVGVTCENTKEFLRCVSLPKTQRMFSSSSLYKYTLDDMYLPLPCIL